MHFAAVKMRPQRFWPRVGKEGGQVQEGGWEAAGALRPATDGERTAQEQR